MAITSADIKLLASVRMTDAEDGGGQMTGTALQDGAENNVYDDISSTDRAFGRLSLRKIWPAVLNTGTDKLLGAHLILKETAADANVYGWAMLGASAAESRAGVLARLEASPWADLGPSVGVWATAPRYRERIKVPAGGPVLAPGHVIYTTLSDGTRAAPVMLLTVSVVSTGDGSWGEGFPSTLDGDVVYAVTCEGDLSIPAGVTLTTAARMGTPDPAYPRVVTTRPVTGTLEADATFCDVDTLLAAIVPKNLGLAAGSAGQIGIDPAAVTPNGRALAFRTGDGLVVHHTASIAATTYANGNTINCGRTGLASARLVDANGLGIATGWTLNRSAGTISVVDIAGWAQPVVVQHTIEDVLACARTGYSEVSGGSAGSSTSEATAPFTLNHGLTMYCGRPNVGSIRVLSKTGQDITNLTHSSGLSIVPYFVVDRAAGTVAFYDGGFGFIASHSPVTLVSSGTFSAVGVPSVPQSPLNRITFNRGLSRAFPAGTLVSSMLFMGDFQARAGASFSQESWGQVWADARIGSAPLAQYNQAGNPIVVTNAGAVSERWAFIFTSSTAFRLVGETLGQVATGDINSNFSPPNPAASGQPYFTIAATGWGTWAAGNVLRLNTYGANAPVWGARATAPSAPSDEPDHILFAVRGDIDA